MTMIECYQIHDWSSWKEVIQAELDSLSKCKVFESVVLTPHNVEPQLGINECLF